MIAQLPRSLGGCWARFLIASRHHHRKPVIVSEFHGRMLPDIDLKGKRQDLGLT
jgi:hypothetical protein